MTAILPFPVTDDTLERARRGDHDAFAELIEEHEAMVFSIALRFFDDRGRAEELAQEVFLQMFRSLRTIESRSHLVFWLRQVTSRRCIDQMRKPRPRAVSIDDVDLAGGGEPRDPLLDRKMRKLIAGLPDMQRLVVTLRYQEDLDPSEICTIVNLPVNTVKSHLHRALVSLRRKLGDQS
jgi:RNA polymerase sigma-70 factor (ECF subfamily)